MSNKEFSILSKLQQGEPNFARLIGGGEFIMELQVNPREASS